MIPVFHYFLFPVLRTEWGFFPPSQPIITMWLAHSRYNPSEVKWIWQELAVQWQYLTQLNASHYGYRVKHCIGYHFKVLVLFFKYQAISNSEPAHTIAEPVLKMQQSLHSVLLWQITWQHYSLYSHYALLAFNGLVHRSKISNTIAVSSWGNCASFYIIHIWNWPCPFVLCRCDIGAYIW